MATNPKSMVQEAVDAAISKRGEIGLQVVAYVDGKQVVDVWSGLADITTGRQVDAGTLFPVFSVTKAVTANDALTHRLGVPIMPLGVTPELMCDWDWMVQDTVRSTTAKPQEWTNCSGFWSRTKM